MKHACSTCGAISDQRRCAAHRGNGAGIGTGTRNPDRDMAAHKRFARAVKKRDGYRCRVCGATEHLIAHHNRPLHAGGTDEPSNGITLCPVHHRQADRYAT
jgi:predicted restriction endonuclease